MSNYRGAAGGKRKNQIIKHSMGANPCEHGFGGHVMTQLLQNSLSNWHEGLECGSSHRLCLCPAHCRQSSELLHKHDENHDEHWAQLGMAPPCRNPSRASQEQSGCSFFPTICKHRAQGPQRSSQPCLRSFAQQQ